MAESATDLLVSLSAGDQTVLDRLLPIVYEELRKIARRRLSGERRDHSLQTTELVHEAYIRLVGKTQVTWQSRAHFIAVASTAMRRILIDHARRKKAAKRGGGATMLSIQDSLVEGQPAKSLDLLELDRALEKLQETQPDKARVVEMRFFGGLQESEVAEVMGISTRTVIRYWNFARAWIYSEMNPDSSLSA